MRDDVKISLISRTVGDTVDEYGEAIITETSTTVFAVRNAVKRNEFYQAQAAGLRPEITFEVYEMEYSGEGIIEFDGKRYNVIRSYPIAGERLELICSALTEVV